MNRVAYLVGHHQENTDTLKKVAEELSQLGGILGGFFSLYSSIAEQCACYPYIFPTIFPRAAAGMLIWFEYTASQGDCLY